MTTRIESEIATSAAAGLGRSAALARGGGLRFGHVATTGSTNDDLAAEARSGDASPAVLVADHQTAGRGRLDRRWVDRAGSDLLVSFRLRAHETPHETVAAVAAALRRAAAELIVEPVGFKWPNDLVVEQGPRPGKLAGILAEYVEGEPPVVVVGCGVNVGPLTSDSGPREAAETGGVHDGVERAGRADSPQPAAGFDAARATSMAAVGLRAAVLADAGLSSGVDVIAGDALAAAGTVRDRLLAATIKGLIERLADPRAAAAELREHSATLGRRVRVEFGGGRTLAGKAMDIDAQGRLVVEQSGRRRIVGAGDIVHLRGGTAQQRSGTAHLRGGTAQQRGGTAQQRGGEPGPGIQR